MQRSIREIVADTDGALRGPKLLWRANEWDRWHATSPMKQLYVGAAGVLWGLDALRRRGHAETTLDLANLAVRNLERFLERPDYIDWNLPEPRDSALFLGEAGIVLVAWRLAPSTELSDRLYSLVRANVENPAEEVFWGAPGTLMAARAMLAWTGEERWRKAADETAQALLRRRGADGLWVQRLYGQETDEPDAATWGRRHRPGARPAARARARPVSTARHRSHPRADSRGRERRGELAAETAPGAPWARRADPPPVVRGGSWDRHRGVGVPRRGAPARRCGARLARRPPRDGEGCLHLPRDGRQRLRVPEGVRANRRRRSGSTVRAGSRYMHSSRSSGRGPSAVAAATRSSRATSERRSSQPTASTRRPGTRSSTRSTGKRRSGRSSQSATKGANHGR